MPAFVALATSPSSKSARSESMPVKILRPKTAFPFAPFVISSSESAGGTTNRTLSPSGPSRARTSGAQMRRRSG